MIGVLEMLYSMYSQIALCFTFKYLLIDLAVLGLRWGTWDLEPLLWRLSIAACGIPFPDQESNPGLLHGERGVSAPGPPGKSWPTVFKWTNEAPISHLCQCQCLSSQCILPVSTGCAGSLGCVCVFYVILTPPDTFCFVVTSTWNKLLEIKLFSEMWGSCCWGSLLL